MIRASIEKLRESYGLPIEDPASVEIIRNEVPEVAGFTDYVIESLWTDYSQRCHCAGYLDVRPGGLQNFREWLGGTWDGAVYA